MKEFTKSSLKITVEIFIGLLILMMFAMGGLAWRLSQGPIVLDQFIPKLETYFNERNSETIDVQSMILAWEGLSEPLKLSVENVSVSNEDGPFLFAPAIDATLSFAALMIGQINFESVWVRDIALSVTKTAEGKITISGQSSTKQEIEIEIDDTQKAVPTTITLNDLIYDMPDMKYFWIDSARIVYRDEYDETVKIFDPVTFLIESTRQDGDRRLSGFVSIPFEKENQDKKFQLTFETYHDPLNLVLHGKFENVPVKSLTQFLPPMPDGLNIDSALNANLKIVLNNLWKLDDFAIDLSAKDGAISTQINQEPLDLEFSDFNLRAHHDLDDNRMMIEDLSLRLNDEVPITITGDVRNFNDINAVSGNMHLAVFSLPHAYFDRYWPKAYTDNGAYRWLTQKISAGFFPTVSASMRFDMNKKTRDDGKPLPAWIESVRGEFTVEKGTVNYNAPMATATEVSGHGVYEDISLTLDKVSGNVGGMKTTGATLHFDDLLTQGQGVGTLRFPITAQAQDVFNYIAAEPITAFEKVDFSPVDTKGDVEAVVDVKIPLLKDVDLDAVSVIVKGTLDNAEINNALKGLNVSGGPYTIEATANDLKLSGSGELNGNPLVVEEWHEYFSDKDGQKYSSKIKGSVTANDAIRQAFINDIAQHFKGETDITFDYLTNTSNKTTINLDLDLTKTIVDYKGAGLHKKSNVESHAALSVTLHNGDLVQLSNMSINGDKTFLDKGEINFQTLDGEPVVTKASLDGFVFNDNRVSVLIAQEGDVLKANVTGEYLNAYPFLSGNKNDIAEATDNTKTTTRPIEIGIDVAQMQMGETKATLKTPKAYIRLGGEGEIERLEMDATLGDKGTEGDFSFRYTPEIEDGLSLRVKSNNAGELLRIFDLYPYLKGGLLQIAGKPIEGGRFGDVEGMARIDNFSISNAPVLLRLVNALSFDNFLTGGALKFTRLESDFKWQLNDKGDLYTIRNGTTSGASVAFTFDGYVNTANDNMEVKGTAAPLSEINNFIGKIPVLGQILTGGGALLAATYTISGNLSDPSVSVNPLSVLTPGIVRKMLFESTPEPKEDKTSSTSENEKTDTDDEFN